MDYGELAVDYAVDIITSTGGSTVPRVAAAQALEWAKGEFYLSPEWLFHVERDLQRWAISEEHRQAEQEESDWQDFLYGDD